jgi:hypothetical protein
MQKIPSRRIQGMLVGVAVLVTMILITACSGVGSTTQTTPTTGTTGTTATTTSSTPVGSPTTTQPAGPTATPVPFKPGGISFIGPVKSITSTSLVMTAPNGQTYTLAINAQTDLSAYNGALPAVGSSVNMDAAVNPDGRSFTATILKPGMPGDPDTNVIAYTGTTTSAVGADRMIHFTVGTKAYIYTIPATADLTDFGGNAQAIGINVLVKVKVLYPANTVVSVGMG